MSLTYREAKYVAAVIQGESKQQALLKAGFTPSMARVPQVIENDEIKAEIERLRAELVNHALQVGLADAQEIHENLTEELRGDLAELYNESGQLKPITEWPMWARQGGVEVLDEPNMVHSVDGENSSWDQRGRKIKVRAGSRAKTKELLMKHVAVNAMVHEKAGDINVLVVTAEKARQVVGARKRLAKVIDIQAPDTQDVVNEEAKTVSVIRPDATSLDE